MAAIEGMIRQSWTWRMEHIGNRRSLETLCCGIRLHALLDSYKALGGDDTKWRNRAGVLRNYEEKG